MKNHKMYDLLGNIDSKYVNEAAHATKLSRAATRRFSLGNIAAVMVGLVAISLLTVTAFWLSGNLGEPPEGGGAVAESPSPTPTPPPPLVHTTPTPAPYGDAARARMEAQILLLQYPTIFLEVMSRHTGLVEIWDQIRSHVDYTGTDFLWSWGSTMDDSYLMDGQGNIITQAPFLTVVDGTAIASNFMLFDEGDGTPLIIIDFHPYWIGSGRYHFYRFDGEHYVPIDSTAATWHTGGGSHEGLFVQPFINDAGDLIVDLGMRGWEGRVLVSEDGRLRPAAFYSFEMVYEWADHVVIWLPAETPDGIWEEHARLTRAEFEAYRQSPDFFGIFPNMPEGEFRMLAPMPDFQAQLHANVYDNLRAQTPASTHVAAPPPTPNPRTEYIGVEDHRDFDYFMELIRETGIHIVTEPQDNIIHPEHEFIASMWFNGEYWVTTMYEFETVFDRVMASDMIPFWRGLRANGRFAMETNHPWLGEFFEGIQFP